MVARAPRAFGDVAVINQSEVARYTRDVRLANRERGGDEGGAESPDPPLHVLSEDKYDEVVL